MEIERKFLLNEIPDTSESIPHIIEQAYISINPEIRIRKEDNDYILTVKGKGDLSREEFNLPITKEEYEYLIIKVEGHFVEKIRYYIPLDDGNIAEMDIYTRRLNGLNTVEVEFETEEEAKSFKPPAWFSKEVTGDKLYENSSLFMKNLTIF